MILFRCILSVTKRFVFLVFYLPSAMLFRCIFSMARRIMVRKIPGSKVQPVAREYCPSLDILHKMTVFADTVSVGKVYFQTYYSTSEQKNHEVMVLHLNKSYAYKKAHPEEAASEQLLDSLMCCGHMEFWTHMHERIMTKLEIEISKHMHSPTFHQTIWSKVHYNRRCDKVGYVLYIMKGFQPYHPSQFEESNYIVSHQPWNLRSPRTFHKWVKVSN